MEEIMKEVLLKAIIGGGSDKVVIVENLPKRLFYTKAPKRVPQMINGYASESETLIVPGEFVDELLEGIEHSQTGDGGYVFNLNFNKSEERFKDVMDYVKKHTPKDHDRVELIPYAQDPTDSRSNPLPLSQIPRIKLPMILMPTNYTPAPQPVSPPAAPAVAPVAPGISLSEDEFKEYQELKKKKEEARERMAKARASKGA